MKIQQVLPIYCQNARTSSTTVDLLSTKVHCEIAGEGVEYSWGQSKNKFLGICCFMSCSERLRMQ
jgi:hypothetical protein